MVQVAPTLLIAQDTLRPSGQDVLREITSYRETDAEIIAKGRSLILDCVRGGDTARGRPVFDYLRDHYRLSRYIPFWPAEKVLLCLWISEYSSILDVPTLESYDTVRYQDAVTPPHDLLLLDLVDGLNPRREGLRSAILHAPLTADESAFLLLLLEWTLSDRRILSNQDPINEDAEAFLREFGDSRYAPIVRRDIRFVVHESRIGYGLSIGLGASAMSGGLGELFTSAGALDLEGDLSMRQLIWDREAMFSLSLSGSLNSKVRKDFIYNGEWAAGMKQSVLIPEASLGVVVFESDLIRLVPSAGVSGILISPPTDENGNSTSDLKLNLLSWSVGLTADWKCGSGNLYWLIRMKLAYAAAFPQPDPRFSGNIIMFTVGLGLFTRSIERDL